MELELEWAMELTCCSILTFEALVYLKNLKSRIKTAQIRSRLKIPITMAITMMDLNPETSSPSSLIFRLSLTFMFSLISLFRSLSRSSINDIFLSWKVLTMEEEETDEE